MILVLFAGLAMVTFSHLSPLHPGASQMLTRQKIENIECRPSTGADSALDREGPSRTANFRLMGTYDCYRPVFSSDERNPYIDHALEAESSHAKRAAVAAARRLKELKVGPVGVKVEGKIDPRLREELASLYRTELVAQLGPQGVRRAGDEQPDLPVVIVQMHNVDVPELMSSVHLQMNKKGEAVWLEL